MRACPLKSNGTQKKHQTHIFLSAFLHDFEDGNTLVISRLLFVRRNFVVNSMHSVTHYISNHIQLPHKFNSLRFFQLYPFSFLHFPRTRCSCGCIWGGILHLCIPRFRYQFYIAPFQFDSGFRPLRSTQLASLLIRTK